MGQLSAISIASPTKKRRVCDVRSSPKNVVGTVAAQQQTWQHLVQKYHNTQEHRRSLGVNNTPTPKKGENPFAAHIRFPSSTTTPQTVEDAAAKTSIVIAFS